MIDRRPLWGLGKIIFIRVYRWDAPPGQKKHRPTPSVICPPPSNIRHPPSVICHLSSTIQHHPRVTWRHSAFAVNPLQPYTTSTSGTTVTLRKLLSWCKMAICSRMSRLHCAMSFVSRGSLRSSSIRY